MAHQRFHFVKRKSLAAFLSENLPNYFLYRCLKANTNLPDETILEVFNEAYQYCIDVLAEPDIRNARSASLPAMGASAPRSSLLRYCFVYYLLSFHEEAANLRPLLFNMRTMLEMYLPEIISPLSDSVHRLAEMFTGTISFDEKPSKPLPRPGNSLISDQYIKIPTLIILAERLPPSETRIVLDVVKQAAAFDKGDWTEILKDLSERCAVRKEPKVLKAVHSKFIIDEEEKTTFVKIMKALFDLHIIKNLDGSYTGDFGTFIHDQGELLNTDLVQPYSKLSKAKSTKIYMKTFAKLCIAAKRFQVKGLGTKGSKSVELTVNDFAKLLDFPPE
jgi:hypothetical protein